jgi:hypothetical protein
MALGARVRRLNRNGWMSCSVAGCAQAIPPGVLRYHFATHRHGHYVRLVVFKHGAKADRGKLIWREELVKLDGLQHAV